MTERRDALVAAARFVLATHSLARSDNGWRATAGELTISHPASNVVPDEVVVCVDARAQSDASLGRLLAGLRERAAESAGRSGCGWQAAVTWQEAAVSMNSAVTRTIAEANRSPAADPIATTSWAGHDAAILATAGVPAAMLLVRAGRGGVSHSPHETADAADVSAAIETLGRALADLAGR
jgi:N-carbamoyl-L-amino-acid hydrolase